jgi:hypothetical protein
MYDERLMVYNIEDVQREKQYYIKNKFRGADDDCVPHSYPAIMLSITSESWDGSDCVDYYFVCKDDFDE